MSEDDVVNDGADLAFLALIETVKVDERAPEQIRLLRVIRKMGELMNLCLERPGRAGEIRIPRVMPELSRDED